MNKLNVKKLLLTIICTIMVSVFIGTTILFITYIPAWVNLDIVETTDADSEAIKNLGATYEKYVIPELEKQSESYKKIYGKDFPTIGLILGIIIYVIAIQKAKGKKLILELLVGFISLVLLIIVLNCGYNLIVNNMVSSEHQISTFIVDLEDYTIYISYITIAIIIYVINMIKQKITASKLNKELNR